MPNDDDDEREMMWEEEAASAVKDALDSAEVDDIRGAVIIPSTDDHRYNEEFTSMDELSQHLMELYDEQWYANVPFDGGEAVFDSDAIGHVADALAATDLEEFFLEVREPENAEKIISSQDLIATPADSKIIRVQFGLIGKEVAAYFAKNPHKLREMDPDDFEELMAAVFRDQGFEVEKTRFSKDGGVDLILVKKNSVGCAMTLVDCKRYAANNKVGIEIVRGLYGVVEQRKATSGMIITTSSFTKGAIDFRDSLEYRLALADFRRVKKLLADWRG